MESPITTVKAALNPSTVLRWAAVAIVAFALADLLNVTDWIIYPITTWKARKSA